MKNSGCRWGILSTAEIAKKNWHAIHLSGNGRLMAVASRSLDRAKQFIAECRASVPVSHPVDPLGSYEELIARADIDAVYVPLPTGLRAEWVLRAAEAGKHVLVEKPCGVSADEVRAMLAACERAGVQFMDGVMFMHSGRMAAIRQVLDDGTSIGQTRRLASQFSFCAPDGWAEANIRAHSALEPAGCLGDLGWYSIRFILWAMNLELPAEVRGRILHSAGRADSPGAVPMEFQGEIHFESGVSAMFYNSFRTAAQQWVQVSGSRGTLQVNDFVLPFLGAELSFEVSQPEFVVEGCHFSMEPRSRHVTLPERSNNAASAQETRLFRTFADLVRRGKPDSWWPEVSLKTQLVLDAALASARQGGVPVAPAKVQVGWRTCSTGGSH